MLSVLLDHEYSIKSQGPYIYDVHMEVGMEERLEFFQMFMDVGMVTKSVNICERHKYITTNFKILFKILFQIIKFNESRYLQLLHLKSLLHYFYVKYNEMLKSIWQFRILES